MVLVIWTVVLAIRKAVIVVYIILFNGTKSCVSDMDTGVSESQGCVSGIHNCV